MLEVLGFQVQLFPASQPFHFFASCIITPPLVLLFTSISCCVLLSQLATEKMCAYKVGLPRTGL